MTASLRLQYLHGGAVTYPAGTTYGPRRLLDFELVWIIRGNVTYHLPHRSYDTGPGSMILARPDFEDRFTWDPDSSTRHAFFHFNLDAVPDLWPAVDEWPVHWRMDDHDIVRPLFRYILAGCGKLRAARLREPDALLTGAVELLLGALLVGPMGQAVSYDRDLPPVVAMAMTYVHDQLNQRADVQLTLADLAKAASVTEHHLCRQFAQTLGVSPMQAVRLYRLDMAVQMLARSNLPIGDVAERCGYFNPYHFSRTFKSVYGLSPREVRQRTAKGLPPPLSPLVQNDSSVP